MSLNWTMLPIPELEEIQAVAYEVGRRVEFFNWG